MQTFKRQLLICTGTGCVSNKSFYILRAFKTELEKENLTDQIELIPTACNGFCGKGPIIIVKPDNIIYQMVTENDVPVIVSEHFLKEKPVAKLIYIPSKEELRSDTIPKMSEIGFYKNQMLIALSNRAVINPESIDEYIGRDGYKALAKVLTTMSQQEIIDEIKASGLRGRGGAGFPTGLKWQFCKASKGDEKYIICNGDEGDPGAFMDRSIIESDPHAVLEGMAIGAYAIGSNKGIIYIRGEYPLAIERLHNAIKQAREYGLLGDNIFGTSFCFDIAVSKGAGAFVCGEETSLIGSLEGEMPEPRVRPPFPAQSGYLGKPTNINNVETWANISKIINRGSKWFSNIGTENSKGTKVFSLVGKVKNTGLVEVPFGIKMRDIIYEIGGGIPGDKKFKAVQTGGPSGGCIPESMLDISVDYESLKKAGTIMGSGGMIVMDE
ncbi:MAG: SLBB domain-containing protein, partial [Calditrichia bacterium]|nr:SLBB domain-containing protein [Calditrichia bacterium]